MIVFMHTVRIGTEIKLQNWGRPDCTASCNQKEKYIAKVIPLNKRKQTTWKCQS